MRESVRGRIERSCQEGATSGNEEHSRVYEGGRGGKKRARRERGKGEVEPAHSMALPRRMVSSGAAALRMMAT